MTNSNEHSKRRSATKSGPGRYHGGGKPGNRIKKPRAVRAYAALMAAWAAKRVPKWGGLRDTEGKPYTSTGREYFPDGTQRRRMWLAGISAQRGF